MSKVYWCVICGKDHSTIRQRVACWYDVHEGYKVVLVVVFGVISLGALGLC